MKNNKWSRKPRNSFGSGPKWITLLLFIEVAIYYHVPTFILITILNLLGIALNFEVVLMVCSRISEPRTQKIGFKI